MITDHITDPAALISLIPDRVHCRVPHAANHVSERTLGDLEQWKEPRRRPAIRARTHLPSQT